MKKNSCFTKFNHEYLQIMALKNVNIICSKSYGFELMMLIYHNSKNNLDYGIEETFESIKYNKNTRPAFINFINYLEYEKIIYRVKSKVKKSKVLLRLDKKLIEEINNLELDNS
jgi:hypothetical protein